MAKFYGRYGLGAIIEYFLEDSLGSTYRRLGLDKNSRILDIGCADGFLPYMLAEAGFKNVTGIDPYIQSDATYENGAKVFKKELCECTDGMYDVITLNHVFEHLPDQLETLVEIKRLLSNGGKLVIRIPTSTSDAFEKFNAHWYQLDAPRHLYLHSHKSIIELLNKAGFKSIDLFCDSTIWQYYSSELYLKDYPFNVHMKKYLINIPRLLLTGGLNRYKKKVLEVNAKLRGDQIVVVAIRK
ncbi:class I SAM-dependent methyltransferase [Polynucleobacter sp. MWH-UH35A]|uniref:class I SAM-dependent methyltransferase n=1 Tax=Polynucleobacter sp. MWH-UH35A TaxID=1855619 RepID=UPI001BFE1870|nr:class I SAM-dependent methyltransferase [Polynucleobacter sp. MWH-UH35A]QWD60456.1 class I SAM-dependent methyltransferase [Polynucleobacter sp. MWH-UH35A]